MELKGKETFAATPEQIWSLLMNTDSLAKITPGLSRIEDKGEGNYDAVAEVKIGPVKGEFHGELAMNDIVENESFVLQVEQRSKIGNVKADVVIRLSPQEDGSTELAFEGDAKLSGLLARTGARVMSGVSNTLTKQFFEGLNNELNNV